MENWRKSVISEDKSSKLFKALDAVRLSLETIPADQKKEIKAQADEGNWKDIVRDNPDLVGGYISLTTGPVIGNIFAVLLSKMLEDEKTKKGSFESSLERYKGRAKATIDLIKKEVGFVKIKSMMFGEEDEEDEEDEEEEL